MKVKMLYYRPHLSSHSFTGATHGDDVVEVREWDVLSPSLTEEVTVVAVPPGEYDRIVSHCNGSEREAQHRIIAEARRRIQHRMLSRLAHAFLDEEPPRANSAG
jgi:hypothetical protein